MPNHVKDIQVPPNVELIHNAWHADFDNLISGSYAVILTVADPDISAGQLVLIKSMRLSKPSIVTDGNCMKDYTRSRNVIFYTCKIENCFISGRSKISF